MSFISVSNLIASIQIIQSKDGEAKQEIDQFIKVMDDGHGSQDSFDEDDDEDSIENDPNLNTHLSRVEILN